MNLSVSTALFLALSGASTMAFVPQSIQRTAASTSLNMAAEGSDRRSFVGQVRLACAGLVARLWMCIDNLRTCRQTRVDVTNVLGGLLVTIYLILRQELRRISRT